MIMDKLALDEMNNKVIEDFRANHGVVGGIFEGMKVLLLHHVGAKSGKQRVSPLVYAKDGDNFTIIASKGGAPTHPDWYHNLVAHPDVTIEVGDETISVRAEVAEGDERQRLYDQQAAIMPQFHEYAEKAGTRQIPLFLLRKR
jgi:deazaflavin-dependent oxidoreductase (nitroreductase family)